MYFYQNATPPLSFSKFLTLSVNERTNLLIRLQQRKNYLVDIISFCLMPNHFHLLLRQIKDNGIAKFIGNLTNSYTRYFNIKNKRDGPLFKGKFKAIRIENEEQLLHVVRYIHLNPYSSFLVKTIAEVFTYPYSSLAEYVDRKRDKRIDSTFIVKMFKTLKQFREFITDQAEYQRSLQEIKYLTLEG